MNFSRALLIKAALLGLAVAALMAAATSSGLFDKNELYLLNARYVLRPVPPIDTAVVMVNIDDDAVQSIGRWPWSWDKFGPMMDMARVYGARRVAFVEDFWTDPPPLSITEGAVATLKADLEAALAGDAMKQREVMRMIPDRTEAFVASLERFPNTFFGNGFTIMEEHEELDVNQVRVLTESYKAYFSTGRKQAIVKLNKYSQSWYRPDNLSMAVNISPVHSALTDSAAGIGFLRIIQDLDGIVRRLPLVVWYDGRIYPSMALSMACHHFGAELKDVQVVLGEAVVIPAKRPREHEVRIPIDEKGYMIVNWVGEINKSFDQLPYNAFALHAAQFQARRLFSRYPVNPGTLRAAPQLIQFVTDEIARGGLVKGEDADIFAKQAFRAWLMEMMIQSKAFTYDKFLQLTGSEHSDVLRACWDQIAINNETAETLKNGADAQYDAILLALNIEHSDSHRFAFDQVVHLHQLGTVDDARPLFFKEPSYINVSGVDYEWSPLNLRDRDLFVGLTATGLNAFNPSPYQQRYPMFGLHPNAYNTIVTEKFIRDQAAWVKYLYITALAVVVSILVFAVPPLAGFLLFVAAAAAFAALGWMAFSLNGLNIYLSAPLYTTGVAWLGATLWRYFEEQRERRRVRGFFSAMVSPEVLKMIEADPGSLGLSGNKTEATMFSSDVSGFTTISEGVTAQELADILNIYLTPMSYIIMTYDGYVDKYEGDAIKADFGVPAHDPNHAWKCCYATLQQQEELAVIQRLILLKYGVKISARMGVNTGIISAGNMGSEKKLQYSVMGDAVTMAEEMEPACKLFDNWISIGATTYLQARDYIDARYMDRLNHLGPGRDVDIYELQGWKREKYLEYWKPRPVPQLFFDSWRNMMPEKILGYIYFWDRKKLPETPFYKDLRGLFGQLADLAVEEIHSRDVADVAEIRADIGQLGEMVKPNRALIEGVAVPADMQKDVDDLAKARDKEEQAAKKVLLGWKTDLKELQNVIQLLEHKVAHDTYEAYLKEVDRLQKRVECLSKRISFPTPDDEIAVKLGEWLKGLITGENKGTTVAQARARALQLRKEITTKLNAFLGTLQARAPEFHEFICEYCATRPDRHQVREHFDSGRALYVQQKWDEAAAAFKQGIVVIPSDGPCKTFLNRIEHFRTSPPPAGWDGTWHVEE